MSRPSCIICRKVHWLPRSHPLSVSAGPCSAQILCADGEGLTKYCHTNHLRGSSSTRIRLPMQYSNAKPDAPRWLVNHDVVRRAEAPNLTFEEKCEDAGPNFYVYGCPGTDVGQSSSVMLLQNVHTATTLRRVKMVSKKAPSILPFVGLQM